jgi:hypothetical protein
MTEDMPEEQTTDQPQDDSEQTESSGQPGARESTERPPRVNESFTPSQLEYINRQMADTRKATLGKFKDSTEYQNLVTRAQAANEVDELRNKVQRLESEKSGALLRYEAMMISGQLRSEAIRRGIPPDRIDDALLLADKSNVKVNAEDGTIAGTEEAIQSLVESRPWLVGPGVGAITTTAGRPAPNLNGGTRGTSATEEAQIQQAMREMQAQGIGRI